MDAREISEGFPRPRDDEPPSLRQDIVDEILDHLRCGVRRELLVNGGDDASALQRVLANFGDPRRVARQLWTQAMWSKIMTQRVTVGLMSVTTVACLLVAGLLWHSVQQQQAANAALLEQVAKLAARSEPPLPHDPQLNHFQVKVTLGSKDGPPGAGFSLSVEKQPGLGDVSSREVTQTRVYQQTDQSGVADLGYVAPGVYYVTLATPWDEQTHSAVRIHPGQDCVEHVVAPEGLPEETKVSMRLAGWPEDLRNQGLWLAARFTPRGPRKVGDREWSMSGHHSSAPGLPALPVVLLSPNENHWITPSVYPNEHTPNGLDISVGTSNIGHSGPGALLVGGAAPSEQPVWSFPSGRYQVAFAFTQVKEGVDPSQPEWKVSQNVLSAKYIGPNGWYWHQSLELNAAAGKANEWAFVVPEQVIQIARDAVKQQEAEAKAQQSASSSRRRAPNAESTLTVKLKRDDPAGQVPQSATVTVQGTHLANESLKGSRQAEDGQVDFGVVPPGGYEISVRTGSARTTRKVQVRKGEGHIAEFVCPNDDPAHLARLECLVDLPADLTAAGLCTLVELEPRKVKLTDDWSVDEPKRIMASLTAEQARQRKRLIETRLLPGLRGNNLSPLGEDRFAHPAEDRVDFLGNVFRHAGSDERARAQQDMLQQSIVGSAWQIRGLMIVTDFEKFTHPNGQVSLPVLTHLVVARRQPADADWADELNADFVLQRDQPWKITLPESLIAESRRQLAESTNTKPE